MDRSGTAGTRPDVPHHHGARWCSVATPEFAPMHSIVRHKKQQVAAGFHIRGSRKSKGIVRTAFSDLQDQCGLPILGRPEP